MPEMTFDELWTILADEIPSKINAHKGLNYFVKNKAKFEGWFKVEICNILSEHTDNIIPEKDRIDIVFDDWALELKTANTNYRYANIEKKTKPITKNINSILKDIRDLQNNDLYQKKAVVFIVFPLLLSTHTDLWKSHLSKIKQEVCELKEKEFTFNNGSKGILYFGLI
jgi:hypothetical protein